MKKAIKIILGIILGAVALVLALVLTLPLWLGPIVKPSANTAVPRVTKTSFHLGHLYLNPYTGRFELGDVQLGNPAGYNEPHALKLNNLTVDIAMTTLADEYVHIEEVTVDGLFLAYVSANGVSNIDQIRYNAAGGKEKFEAKKAQAKADRAKVESTKIEEPEKAAEEPTASRKFVIDRLTINDIKLKYGPLTLPVPSITLKDLGKKSDGITMAELGDQILQAILKSATAVGDGAKAFGKFLGDGASKSTDAVKEGTSKAVDSVKEGTGKAVDAVGEGATKAVDALKSLF